MGDLREPDGGSTEDTPEPSSLIVTNPSSSLIEPARWAKAEIATQNIICKVHPTAVSEERRKEVIDYVQRLIRGSLGCEVFPYGSVPLKTYLPDGDIDLTAFGCTNSEEKLADEMVSLLKDEEKNTAAEFVVKDVQLIRAEVKLVKCIVQNIVVDISFNQIGGLCTLCFLEQVDRRIGKEHLFKRSIILIKAWCYYESRILGAHHALISTYALETLVLYIFHLFHSTLDGPLAVLYKFLDYFSQFDWENYCISLTGPVRLSSLPELIAEIPGNGIDDLLLSRDFLRYCIDMFSVPSKEGVGFQQKHLNIVDPLKETNNLGRSVSKGNFYRIRSAFTYGAKKLGRILLQQEDDIADELNKFFSNTLERHGHGQRPDVQDSGPLSNSNQFSPATATSESESSGAAKATSDRKVPDSSTPVTNPGVSYQDRFDNTEVSRVGTKFCTLNGNEEHKSETNGPVLGTGSGYRQLGEAEDITMPRIQGPIISNNKPNDSASIVTESVPLRLMFAPHQFFTNSLLHNGKVDSDPKKSDNCEEKISKVSQLSDDIGSAVDENLIVTEDVSFSRGTIPFSEGNSCIDHGASNSGDAEPTNSLSDLSGDLDVHFSCLQYGRWCYNYRSGGTLLPIPLVPAHFQMPTSWDAIQHPSHFKRNGYSHGNSNGLIPRSAFYPMNAMVMPGVVFGLEDMPKPRGTGTYFPNMNQPPQGYRPSATRGRHQQPSRSPRNNGRNSTYMETSNHDRSFLELPQPRALLGPNGMKQGTSDVQQSFSPRGKGNCKVNGFVGQSEGFVEFGSVGQVPLPAPLPERSRQQMHGSSSPNNNPVSPTLGMQRFRPVLGRDQDRVSMKSSYRLKDEDDFPPLSF